MTHDELLRAINSVVESGPCETVGHWSSAKALCSVVELHKPWYRPGLTKPAPVCAICYTDEGIRVFYPCPTIQAIEKELK